MHTIIAMTINPRVYSCIKLRYTRKCKIKLNNTVCIIVCKINARISMQSAFFSYFVILGNAFQVYKFSLNRDFIGETFFHIYFCICECIFVYV